MQIVSLAAPLSHVGMLFAHSEETEQEAGTHPDTTPDTDWDDDEITLVITRPGQIPPPQRQDIPSSLAMNPFLVNDAPWLLDEPFSDLYIDGVLQNAMTLAAASSEEVSGVHPITLPLVCSEEDPEDELVTAPNNDIPVPSPGEQHYSADDAEEQTHVGNPNWSSVPPAAPQLETTDQDPVHLLIQRKQYVVIDTPPIARAS